MIMKVAALSIVLVGSIPGLAFAEDRGSQDDQAACEPDVHRLCDQYIPDEGQIVLCLKKEKKHLQSGLRARHGAALNAIRPGSGPSSGGAIVKEERGGSPVSAACSTGARLREGPNPATCGLWSAVTRTAWQGP